MQEKSDGRTLILTCDNRGGSTPRRDMASRERRHTRRRRHGRSEVGSPHSGPTPSLMERRSSSLQTRVFFASTTKKRGRFCASRVTYAANGQKPAVVLARNAQFQKSRVMSATENQPRQKNVFFVESARTQPEATDRHRQSPLRVHSNSPKNRRFAAGGSSAVHRPFSSGSVSVLYVRARTSPLAGGRRPLRESRRPETSPILFAPRVDIIITSLRLLSLALVSGRGRGGRRPERLQRGRPRH